VPPGYSSPLCVPALVRAPEAVPTSPVVMLVAVSETAPMMVNIANDDKILKFINDSSIGTLITLLAPMLIAPDLVSNLPSRLAPAPKLIPPARETKVPLLMESAPAETPLSETQNIFLGSAFPARITVVLAPEVNAPYI
jgi:hypothetical protein